MADPRIRNIKIKTGVVKRLAKEKQMYKKEVEAEKAKADKMKEEQRDEHEIKKQIEVLNESMMMIPDCRKRLVNAHEELTNLLETEKDLAESEEYIAAQTILQESKQELED